MQQKEGAPETCIPIKDAVKSSKEMLPLKSEVETDGTWKDRTWKASR